MKGGSSPFGVKPGRTIQKGPGLGGERGDKSLGNSSRQLVHYL